MKHKPVLLCVCLLLCLAPALAFAGDKQPPNPADYPLTAHVVASRFRMEGSVRTQRIFAVIDGRQVELEGSSGGVLALGDYKARIQGSYTKTKPNAYDTYVSYELLFPDGHTRPYLVIGLGFDFPVGSMPDHQP